MDPLKIECIIRHQDERKDVRREQIDFLIKHLKGSADDDTAALLKETDTKIAAQPDDPLLHYRRAQYLARLKQYDEAYSAANAAMSKFTLAKKELAWLMLEKLEVKGHPVTVHFNMGNDERQPPETGISRPLSFRVFSKEGTAIVDTFDFEIGHFNGKQLTAAFGQTTSEGHANFGISNPTHPYSKIRQQAIELIGQRVSEQ
jgi:hypothetical protein